MENRNTLYKMTKTITHIEVPKEWESTNDWDSHRPALWLAVTKGGDKIWEVGCGEGSTKLLYDYCKANKKWFTSLETNKEWSAKIPQSFHVEDYIGVLKTYLPISILFVDCAPAEIRKDIISEFKNDTDVIIVHDSEKSSQFCYDLEPTLSQFEYRLDYEPVGKPHTTIISRKINVCGWVD